MTNEQRERIHDLVHDLSDFLDRIEQDPYIKVMATLALAECVKASAEEKGLAL